MDDLSLGACETHAVVDHSTAEEASLRAIASQYNDEYGMAEEDHSLVL